MQQPAAPGSFEATLRANNEDDEVDGDEGDDDDGDEEDRWGRSGTEDASGLGRARNRRTSNLGWHVECPMAAGSPEFDATSARFPNSKYPWKSGKIEAVDMAGAVETRGSEVEAPPPVPRSRRSPHRLHQHPTTKPSLIFSPACCVDF